METESKQMETEHPGRFFEEFRHLALQHLHLHDLHVGAHRPLCSAGEPSGETEAEGHSEVILKLFCRKRREITQHCILWVSGCLGMFWDVLRWPDGWMTLAKSC